MKILYCDKNRTKETIFKTNNYSIIVSHSHRRKGKALIVSSHKRIRVRHWNVKSLFRVYEKLVCLSLFLN